MWWPDPEHRSHRVLRSALDAVEILDDEFAGDVSGDGEPFQIPRYACRPPDRATRGHIEAMALYAGQSVGAARAVEPAGDVVRQLCEGAEALLRRWS